MEPGGSVRHWQDFSNDSYSWTESTQFLVLIPISLRSILILSSHLRLGLPVNILKALLPSSIVATCPVHLNLIDVITLTILGERFKLWSSSLWSLLHSSFSSLLCHTGQRKSKLMTSYEQVGADRTMWYSHKANTRDCVVRTFPALR